MEDSPVSCPKCGEATSIGSPCCSRCSWPFSSPAWHTTSFRVNRVTIDTGCINVRHTDESLNTLERWQSEGKLSIQRSDPLIEELRGREQLEKAQTIEPHPPVWELGMSALGIDTFLAGPDVGPQVTRIMFPTTKVLISNQEYDVAHLRSHVLTGGDVFVTKNPNDFTVRGKKERLSSLGIWVFEPHELVTFLSGLYGWDLAAA